MSGIDGSGRLFNVSNSVGRCCERCGATLQPAPGAGRPARFCGVPCRAAAYRALQARRLVLGELVESRMRRGDGG